MMALDLNSLKKDLLQVEKFVNTKNPSDETQQEVKRTLTKLLKQIDDGIAGNDVNTNESTITTRLSALSDNDFNSIMNDITQVL